MADTARKGILVVEDEANIASFVAMYLKKAGFDVGVARNGAEALAKTGTESPSLIVLDLMLPDLDGIDVCRRIRQRSDVPIYVACNAFWEPIEVELPETEGKRWYRVVDTSLPEGQDIVLD